MDDPPPSLGRPTDPGAIKIGGVLPHREKRDGEVLDQVKTEASSSKLVGEKRRALETKLILKKVKKMEAKAAHMRAEMRAETSNLRAENGEMEAAAEEKEREVILLKEKRDGFLADMLLMSVTEHFLKEILFPPSEDY